MGSKGFPEEFLRRFHPWSPGLTPYSPTAPPLPSFKAVYLPIHCLSFHPHKVLSRGGRGAFQLLHLGLTNSSIVCCEAGSPLLCQSWLLETDPRLQALLSRQHFYTTTLMVNSPVLFAFLTNHSSEPWDPSLLPTHISSLPLGVFDPPLPSNPPLKAQQPGQAASYPGVKTDACSSWSLCSTRSYFDYCFLTTFNLFC